MTATSEDSDRALILETLEQAGWIVSGPRGATAELGLKRTTLLAKMKRLGISRPIPEEGTSVFGLARQQRTAFYRTGLQGVYSHLGMDLHFQSEVGIEVDLGGLDRFVIQPECSERTITLACSRSIAAACRSIGIEDDFLSPAVRASWPT